MSKAVKISKGSSGWGGPLTVAVEGKKDKILVVCGGDIPEVAMRLEEMTGATIVDGFSTGCPDDEVMVAIVDCGGTARCGVYPKKGIPTINLMPVGQSGPLAMFIKETNYVSDVKPANLEFTDGTPAPAAAPAPAPKADNGPKSKEQAKAEIAASREGKKQNIVTRLGVGVGQVVSKFFAAGRETIDMIIRNVLPFMAFTSTLLGIISASGLGDIIANTISPLCGTLPGMLVISIICAIPIVSAVLGPGAVIASVVGVLLGQQFGNGSIPPQYALPALFAIDAQVGCDFIPVGLSLGEAEPETIEIGVPAVMFSRLITGPLAVLIAFAFSIGMY